MIFASFHQGKEEIIFAFAFPIYIFPDMHRPGGGLSPVQALKSIDNNWKIIYNGDRKDLSPLIYKRR